MFSWLKRDKSERYVSVLEGLKSIYSTKLLPLEQYYHFHEFHSPQLDDTDFEAKPMILLVGQYSTGKTTFVKYLTERDFPGIRIGPEPTTDKFIVVMYDEKEGMIPGHALVVDPKRQFRPLSKFGNTFLNRLQCSLADSPILQNISIIDTPGVLSGEKQRVDRGYNFTAVLKWFAERADRIILLFDAHKLDISDELRRSIEALRGHDEKIRIVLNKADMIDQQELMRVYGALMWSLGKVLPTSEVVRVYIGSFWDQPLGCDVNRKLFENEEKDLLKDLQSLSRYAALRKLNDLIKRARLAKVHAHIIAELRKEMPYMFGKDLRKEELILNLGAIYRRIQNEYLISPGDFPELRKMQEILSNTDFSKFQPLNSKLLNTVDCMLADDICNLMAKIPLEETDDKVGSFDHDENTASTNTYEKEECIDSANGIGKKQHELDEVVQRKSSEDEKVSEVGNLRKRKTTAGHNSTISSTQTGKEERSITKDVINIEGADDGTLNASQLASRGHFKSEKAYGKESVLRSLVLTSSVIVFVLVILFIFSFLYRIIFS